MSIFQIAVIIGLLLPGICLAFLWKDKPARNYILLFILLQFVQILSERALVANELRYVIKYSAFVFVCIRLYQLFVGWGGFRRILASTRLPVKYLFWTVYVSNWILWIIIAFRLLSRIVQTF